MWIHFRHVCHIGEREKVLIENRMTNADVKFKLVTPSVAGKVDKKNQGETKLKVHCIYVSRNGN
jgi:hypothetical protein